MKAEQAPTFLEPYSLVSMTTKHLTYSRPVLVRRAGVVSVGPWGGTAAVGAGVEGGLALVLGWSCSEIRFRPSNCEPGTAREAERDRSELMWRRPSMCELV